MLIRDLRYGDPGDLAQYAKLPGGRGDVYRLLREFHNHPAGSYVVFVYGPNREWWGIDELTLQCVLFDIYPQE